jgi:hypothetical protein
VSVVTTIWFTWGGVRDLRRLFVRLRAVAADRTDDGTVFTPAEAVDERRHGHTIPSAMVSATDAEAEPLLVPLGSAKGLNNA